MERGGSHPRWGTENALIVFGDGSYLELLAVREGARTDHRLWRRPDGTLRRSGTVSAFALGVTDLSAAVARLRAAGVPCSDPQDGARLRPDGRRLAWRLAFPDAGELPFLIEDVTPRADRVPLPPPGSLNAGTELARVSTVSSDPTRAWAAYEAMLHASPSPSPDATVAVRIGRGEIALRPAYGASEESGVETITLRVPAGAREALPLVELDGVPCLDPDAVGGLRVAVTSG